MCYVLCQRLPFCVLVASLLFIIAFPLTHDCICALTSLSLYLLYTHTFVVCEHSPADPWFGLHLIQMHVLNRFQMQQGDEDVAVAVDVEGDRASPSRR